MAKFKPVCRLVTESNDYPEKTVCGIRYDTEDLAVTIEGPGFARAEVVFRQPLGFRVLDEADLTEFWNAYSKPNGWLWEVEEGGWLELERHRESFWRAEGAVREYFITDDTCINVLAWEPPEIVSALRGA